MKYLSILEVEKVNDLTLLILNIKNLMGKHAFQQVPAILLNLYIIMFSEFYRLPT